MKVNLSLIVASRNIRLSNLDNLISDLKQSMAKNGLLEPIKVYRFSDVYIIKDGHRRFVTALALGWSEIECDLVEMPEDEAELAIYQYVINTHRRGLSFLETANTCKVLKGLGMSQVSIADRLGLDETTVSQALSLLNANQALQEAVETGRISPSAAELLLPLSNDEQRELLPAAIKAKTARRVTSLVKAHRTKTGKLGRSKVTRTSDIPEDADPLDILALDTIDGMMEMGQTLLDTPPTCRGNLLETFRDKLTQLSNLIGDIFLQLNEEPA